MLGLAGLSGCGALDISDTPAQDSTGRPTRDQTLTGTPDPTDSSTRNTSHQSPDIIVYDRQGEYHIVDGEQVTSSQSSDLGHVINEAQAMISEGSILIAADGQSRTEIVHSDSIVIGGIEGRTTLTPTEDIDRSFDMYHTPNGPDGSRFESFQIDLEDRGRTAIRSAGFSDIAFDRVRIHNTVKHGLTLSEGRTAEVRNCRFREIGDDAIRIDNTSDVTIDNCIGTETAYGIHARDSSNVVVRGYRSQDAQWNGVAIYDYTENWKVIGCRAVDDGHTPFAASPALNGSFIGCVAEGTTAEREGGFEIEYKAGHDSDNREEPVEGCSVVSCTAIECNLGFYAREDTSKDVTNTQVIRPRFIDCTAIDCETGLFVDENVVEAIIRDFTPVACATDIVDHGTRTVIDGRSENEGDPAVEGQWNGHGRTAADFGVTIRDTTTETRYKATKTGTWEHIS